MSPEERARRNARKRQWRRDHPELARAKDRADRERRRVTPAQRQRAITKSREWYENNPERRRDWMLRHQYGITLTDYNAMLAKQRGKCAICGRPEQRRIRGEPRPLTVDHDHRTSKVRGLLCANCNNGIGLFGDSPHVLLVAAMYVEPLDWFEEAA